ncbi:hypothetical protein BCR43DRAFT_484170 [Syncephalastrum racemosum]|uniref:Uncharacterized protein n=1 Tax=Syncephalastrum racemosum TaxID=13706 RepID=A0A1X2HWC9_SYNRA|nr:hypothetical protein BCR43DRAFT_484170 [Syncephalastrum racemosum]
MKHSILLLLFLLQLTLAAVIMPEGSSEALLDDAAAVMDARLFTTADERPEEQATLNDEEDEDEEEQDEIDDDDMMGVDDDAEDDIFPDFKNDEGQAPLFDAPPPHLFKEDVDEEEEDDDALWLEEDLDIDLAPYQWQWRGFLVISVLILAYQAWQKRKCTHDTTDEATDLKLPCMDDALPFHTQDVARLDEKHNSTPTEAQQNRRHSMGVSHVRKPSFSPPNRRISLHTTATSQNGSNSQ